jgi:AraC-like DNA-binding protein
MVAVAPSGLARFHFSTDAFPERDRVAQWREVLGRKLIRLDVEPDRDTPFHAHFAYWALPGLCIGRGDLGASVDRRTPELIEGDADNFFLAVNLQGDFIGAQNNREVACGAGDAFLGFYGEPIICTRPVPGGILCLRLPRASLAPLVPSIDDATLRLIPASSAALRLLCSYVGALGGDVLDAPEVCRAAVGHIRDLVDLAVDAHPEAARIASAGLRAARLQAIKADIARRFADEGLSVGDAARRHGVTPRYVHMLFESEGRTFTEFLIEQRLTQAHRMLTDSQLAARTISAIAFEVGFANLSYFNRCYRRRYGASPSDIREAARSADKP